MTPETVLQLALRLLPSLVFVALALVAAADIKTRQRWTDLLYQAGALRPEQRDDLRAQRGVRLPFFLVAVLLLLWPIGYYRNATRVVVVSSSAYGKPASGFNPYAKPGQTPPATPDAATGNAVPAAPTPIAPPPAAPAPVSPPAP